MPVRPRPALVIAVALTLASAGLMGRASAGPPSLPGAGPHVGDAEATSLGMLAYEAVSPGTGHREVFTIRTDGSERHRLTDSGGEQPAWSPDGTQVVYAAHDDLWIVGADGSGAHRVAAAPEDDGYSAPAWSPDGSTIAAQTRSSVVLVDVGTSAVTTLVAPTRRWIAAGSPAWSPDGTTLALTRTHRHLDIWATYEIFTIGADGSGLTPLAETRGDGQEPDWSPDGARIVYTDFDYGDADIYTAELCTVAADGTDRQVVTAVPGYHGAPSWSPDGSSIAETAFGHYLPFYVTDDPLHLTGIWTVDPTGGDRRLVVRDGSHPDWRPGYQAEPAPPTAPTPAPGERIAVVAASAAGNDLVTLEPDGSDPAWITSSGWVSAPAWSPDHTRLAYVDQVPGEWGWNHVPVVHVVDSDGRHDAVVATPSAVHGGLTWSPDGRRLAWATGRDVVVRDLVTGATTRLASTNTADPEWSPDGSRIVVGNGTGTWPRRPRGLQLIRVEDGARRTIADGPGLETAPTWAPGGHRLVYTRTTDGRTRLEMVGADGRDRHVVWATPQLDTVAAWSPDGRVAVVSDGPSPFGSTPQPGVWVFRPDDPAEAPGLALLDRSVSDLDW